MTAELATKPRRIRRLVATAAAASMLAVTPMATSPAAAHYGTGDTEHVERLELRCANVSTGTKARIGCKWTAPEHHRVHHYRLWRANKGTERQVIWRGDTQGYRDPMVRRGVTYAYLVEAINPHGRVVGRSNVDFAKVPRLERLDMACRAGVVLDAETDERHPFAACKWSEIQHPRAAGYKLIRIDEDGNRTVVLATRNLSRTRFVDRTVEWGSTYAYRVNVVGGGGRVIGFGGPVKVHVGDG